MFSRTKTEKLSNDNVIWDFVKGTIIAIIVSLVLVVLFAFFIKWFNLSDNFIYPVTLGIKAISVIFGALVAVKGSSKGLIKGSLFGICYIVFAFLLFSVLSGGFSVELSSLLDLLSAAILGGIVGIIKVNRAQK